MTFHVFDFAMFVFVCIFLLFGSRAGVVSSEHLATPRLLWLITYILGAPSADGIPFQVGGEVHLKVYHHARYRTCLQTRIKLFSYRVPKAKYMTVGPKWP